MLYILGVDHSFQSYYDKSFNDFIKFVIQQYSIELIGEEYSTEVCRVFHLENGSQLKHLSDLLALQHIYCDPTEEEREKLGIETETQVRERLELGFKGRIVGSEEYRQVKKEMRKQWKLREKEWLKRLYEQNFTHKNTLFILGNSHTKRFSDLVKDINAPFIILDADERFKHELSQR